MKLKNPGRKDIRRIQCKEANNTKACLGIEQRERRQTSSAWRDRERQGDGDGRYVTGLEQITSRGSTRKHKMQVHQVASKSDPGMMARLWRGRILPVSSQTWRALEIGGMQQVSCVLAAKLRLSLRDLHDGSGKQDAYQLSVPFWDSQICRDLKCSIASNRLTETDARGPNGLRDNRRGSVGRGEKKGEWTPPETPHRRKMIQGVPEPA